MICVRQTANDLVPAHVGSIDIGLTGSFTEFRLALNFIILGKEVLQELLFAL